jgi:hypothetical protein
MKIDLGKISGDNKKCWWFNPQNGQLEYMGEFPGKEVKAFQADVPYQSGNDRVLIAINAAKEYLSTTQKNIIK